MEAQALTRGYVEAHGRRLTEAVCASSAEQEWTEAREPRAPRAVCGAMLQVLADGREETLQLIDSSVLQGSNSGTSACLCGRPLHAKLSRWPLLQPQSRLLPLRPVDPKQSASVADRPWQNFPSGPSRSQSRQGCHQ